MEQNNRIAVIGGTGKAGRYLVNQLVDQGYSVRTLIRNPNILPESNFQSETITGDVRDYNSVHISLVPFVY